jgi:hypothetical protein
MKTGCPLHTLGLWNISLGHVCAAGLFGVLVACERIGAGARPSTNLLELAGTAFAFQLRRISQALKKWGFPINDSQFLLANVAR